MRKKRILASIIMVFLLMLCITTLPACSSEKVIDFTRMSAVAQETNINKLLNDSTMLNRVYKMRGSYNSSALTLYFIDKKGCCPITLNITAAKGVSLPSRSGTITVIGKYIYTSINGRQVKALEVTKVL